MHHHTNKCKWCDSNFSGLRLVPDNAWSHSTEAHSTHFQRPGASVSQCRWGSKTRPVTLRWAGKQQMLHPAWLRGPRGGHCPSGLLARIRTAQTFSLMWFLAKSLLQFTAYPSPGQAGFSPAFSQWCDYILVERMKSRLAKGNAEVPPVWPNRSDPKAVRDGVQPGSSGR